MKALAYYGKEDLRLVELPRPTISENEILLQIKQVGICGTDLHIYHGGMTVPTPLVMGHEFVGDVVEVGAQVTHLQVGDRAVAEHVMGCGNCDYCSRGQKNLCIAPVVIGLHRSGALAEFMVLPAELVFKLPDGLSYEEGVLAEPLSIAVYAVQKAKLRVGQFVVVIGQGPIGLFLDVVAKERGVKVIGVDVLDARLDYAQQHGFVDYCINSKAEDVLKKIQEITGSDGADVVFEAVGIEPTARMALDVTRRGGEVVMLGVFERDVLVNMMQIVKKELVVSGSWTCLDAFPATIALLETKKIHIDDFITHRYSFDNAIKAFEEASTYGANRIKSVIEL
jgi:2-desacetyl-2-hydroxyethyl bacteriochlorophyllide A dehydrogenase